MNPESATHQLQLWDSRGSVSLTYFDPTISKKSDRKTYYETYCKKKWIIENWGNPDESYKENGLEYFVYKKKDRIAPRYQMQYAYGEHPIKLGYKKNLLVYVETYFGDRKWFKGQNPYILPK